jgi:tRNA threonylcarbamoyladenosine biosynthesis protein TsaB
MIILILKTSQPLAELYLYRDKQLLNQLSWQADRHLAETINLKIDQLLSKASLNLTNLDGLGVFTGPGSFTGLRIGLSVANAMAYGLNIPIIGSRGDDWIITIIDQLVKGRDEHIVIPFYGSPARITKPRK